MKPPLVFRFPDGRSFAIPEPSPELTAALFAVAPSAAKLTFGQGLARLVTQVEMLLQTAFWKSAPAARALLCRVDIGECFDPAQMSFRQAQDIFLAAISAAHRSRMPMLLTPSLSPGEHSTVAATLAHLATKGDAPLFQP